MSAEKSAGRVVAVEPPGRELELFNRADPHCELCRGLGRHRRRPCACTKRARR